MKKLMSMLLGLSLALGCVSVAFGDDAPAEGKAAKKGHKGGKNTKKQAPKKKQA